VSGLQNDTRVCFENIEKTNENVIQAITEA